MKGGKCYFFSQDVLTWVAAEEECKSNGSHLASVTDQQTDDFIANKTKKGESFWIGARQTFESNKGRWAWTDCSRWNYTSWRDFYDPDDELGHECVLHHKSVTNIDAWIAGRCDDSSNLQFRYVCSKAICGTQGNFISSNFKDCSCLNYNPYHANELDKFYKKNITSYQSSPIIQKIFQNV